MNESMDDNCCCVCMEDFSSCVQRAPYLDCDHPTCEKCMLLEFIARYEEAERVTLRCPMCRRAVAHMEIMDHRYAGIPVHCFGLVCASVMEFDARAYTWQHWELVAIVAMHYYKHRMDFSKMRRMQTRSGMSRWLACVVTLFSLLSCRNGGLE